MKFKHVFLLWLYANLILIAGSLLAIILSNIFSESGSDDFGIFLLVILYGIAITIPSLIALLLFHYFVRKAETLKNNYFQIYLIVVVIINFIYLLCSYLFFKMDGEFGLIFIFTTLAGFLSLLLVRRKIRKSIFLDA